MSITETKEKKQKFISDIIDIKDLKADQFNLIASGCGTGKSFFVSNFLLGKLPKVKPNEILFITSRSLIVDQQSYSQDSVVKFNPRDIGTIKQWNGETDIDSIICDEDDKIPTMTYDKLIYILKHCNSTKSETLSKIKIIVFDECHTLFSDNYIHDIAILRLWITQCIYRKNKIFIGLTATPDIIRHYSNEWGVIINQLNKNVLINYLVQNLFYTDLHDIPYLLKEYYLTRNGKTIIMCRTVASCFKLNNKTPNSAVLISKSNRKNYDEDNMTPIRNYIIENENLPESFIYYKKDEKKNIIGQEEIKLDVLITTSTLREGINLKEESGIENVICCIPDELHISQFVGRCRFNIHNLIIAYEYMPKSKKTNKYLQEKRDEFTAFINDNSDERWFKSIKHLVRDGCKPKQLLLGKESFISYLENKWIKTETKIYTNEQRQEILDVAIGCKLLKESSIQQSKITFNKVINYIKEELGYEVKSGRFTLHGAKYSYKQINKKE